MDLTEVQRAFALGVQGQRDASAKYSQISCTLAPVGDSCPLGHGGNVRAGHLTGGDTYLLGVNVHREVLQALTCTQVKGLR